MKCIYKYKEELQETVCGMRIRKVFQKSTAHWAEIRADDPMGIVKFSSKTIIFIILIAPRIE